MRYNVIAKNLDQMCFILIQYIKIGDCEKAIDLTENMFKENLCHALYNCCIEFYLYNCCIMNPEFLTTLLSYRHDLEYYTSLVLHLIFTPKQYLFDYLSSYYYHNYFFLLNERKWRMGYMDNSMELRQTLDIYYKSMNEYLVHRDLNMQNHIAKQHSDILYYLLNHTNYIQFSRELWKFELSISGHGNLIPYINKIYTLHEYLDSKTLKLLCNLYSILFRFYDVQSVSSVFYDNEKKVKNYLKKKIRRSSETSQISRKSSLESIKEEIIN
jgi:hypothetical protein